MRAVQRVGSTLVTMVVSVLIAGLAAGCGQRVVEHTADWPWYDTLEALHETADLVIVGTVRDDATVQELPLPPGTIVCTVVSVEVGMVVKGSVTPGDTVTVKQEGGTYDGVTHRHPSVVYLVPNERYVLFLATFEDSPASWLNPTQAQYRLDDSGEPAPLTGNPLTFTMAELTALAAPR